MDRIFEILVREKISCCNNPILELAFCQSKPEMTDDSKICNGQFLL
jgi:hypothetical protein